MGPWIQGIAMAFALVAGADGMINEGDRTTLPVSPNGGMSTLDPGSGDVYGFTDAGLLWAPTPEEVTVQQMDAGASREIPDGGSSSSACAPIAAEIAHRRAYIAAIEKKSNEVGLDKGPLVYCEQHPAEIECTRPPIAVERELSELIQNDPSEPVPEADAWIVRWQRELAACEAKQKPAPRSKKR